MEQIFLNGEFLPIDKAKVSVLDRGFLYGDGLFETIRCYNGKFFRFDLHYQRLKKSLQILKININQNIKILKDLSYKVLELNNIKDGFLKIIVTRGISKERGLDFSNVNNPTLLIQAGSYKPFPLELYKKGVDLYTVNIPHSQLNLKTLSFLNNVLARYEVLSKGGFEGIFLSEKGEIIEGTISNIMFIKEDCIIVPRSKFALSGVTKKILLKLIKDNKFMVYNKRRVFLNEIENFSEGFITNSLIEIMPVRTINKKLITETPQKTIELLNLYHKEVKRQCY